MRKCDEIKLSYYGNFKGKNNENHKTKINNYIRIRFFGAIVYTGIMLMESFGYISYADRYQDLLLNAD